MRTAIINARPYGGEEKTVLCKNGKIEGLLAPGAAYEADAVIDAAGAYLFPGLIDVHSHGCLGMDVMDGKGLDEMAKEYLRNGVTTWLPTTTTDAAANIRAAGKQPLNEQRTDRARTPGFHYEGPFINQKYKGAQNPAYIQAPSLAEFEQYEHAALITVAPEMPGAIDFIREATSRGACVALGHTDCDYDTACAAFAAGAKCLTHTCNAMPPILHRAPGPIGAAMVCGAYAQVISDGVHLHPAMVLALYRMFGRKRMVLISDSVSACGMPDGSYTLGGLAVTVKNGEARIANGALAGSTTPLYECVKRAISFGIPARDAFAMASETPAEMLGLKKGKLRRGYAAEFVLCNEEYELQKALVL